MAVEQGNILKYGLFASTGYRQGTSPITNSREEFTNSNFRAKFIECLSEDIQKVHPGNSKFVEHKGVKSMTVTSTPKLDR